MRRTSRRVEVSAGRSAACDCFSRAQLLRHHASGIDDDLLDELVEDTATGGSFGTPPISEFAALELPADGGQPGTGQNDSDRDFGGLS